MGFTVENTERNTVLKDDNGSFNIDEDSIWMGTIGHHNESYMYALTRCCGAQVGACRMGEDEECPKCGKEIRWGRLFL